jgi:succinate dehydrogenase/fumarate reductase-like Fe-S protein
VKRKRNVTIRRFDPESGESCVRSYQVEAGEEKESVMNVLDAIAESVDPSLAYYGPCRAGKCGGCLMLVNGKASLACSVIAEGDLLLEPLPDRRILADLITE